LLEVDFVDLESDPRQMVAMLSPGERVISREQAFVILERLDQVEAQLEHLRDRVRLAEVDGESTRPKPASRTPVTGPPTKVTRTPRAIGAPLVTIL
ncbi:MAG: hypothetical protein ABWZ14_08035, partial [Acidimicrobiales bacterium]